MKERLVIFERHRPRLLGIAYRMLGEMEAAEDVVQETWLRWHAADMAAIRDPRAWLAVVSIRLSLDMLGRARSRRETYVGPWLPEPLMPDDVRAFAADDVAWRTELASDLSLALLHILQRLSPEERAAFILRDAFECDYGIIARALGKNEAACRKLISRARERIRLDRPRFEASDDARRDLLGRLMKASAALDEAEMAQLFAPDAIAYFDGGGRVRTALNPILGGERMTRFVLGIARKAQAMPDLHASPADINGQPGIVLFAGETMFMALTIEVSNGMITALYAIQNPEKLKRMALAGSARADGDPGPA